MSPPLRLGVVGCANIARRSMLPALAGLPGWRLTAVASRTAEKARLLAEAFGAEPVVGYDHLLARSDLDAVYLPLPTGLHREWIGKAVAAGKHLLVEKSFAEEATATATLLEQARGARVCVVENYLFPHHAQTRMLHQMLAGGEIGELLLLRTTFSFPPLPSCNFRYDAALGGGALLDAGGYVVRIAREFLGDDLTLLSGWLEMDPERGVDVAGAAMLRNSAGVVAQGYFGFHSHYQCLVEFLGTRGKLSTGRIFTAPPDYTATITLEQQGHREERVVLPDHQYRNMWLHFQTAILGGDYEPEYRAIQRQSDLQTQIRTLAHAHA